MSNKLNIEKINITLSMKYSQIWKKNFYLQTQNWTQFVLL